MRAGFVLLLLLAAPAAALADPVQEARSATGACLSAILDGAPVGDVKGEAVEIRRQDPNTCTVQVTGIAPVQARAALLEALEKRRERFTPAKTHWEAAPFASRETFCNTLGGKHANVLISTSKPGAAVAAIATVLESKARDPRCDRDEGMQRAAAGN